MNIRKLEDLSKDELIELIKQEREACIKHVPISVEERLPEPHILSSGYDTGGSKTVLIYVNNGKKSPRVGRYIHSQKAWLIYRDNIDDYSKPYDENITHWLPIPEIEE